MNQNTPIEELDLSIHTFNKIKRKGINTVGDALKAHKEGMITGLTAKEILEKTGEDTSPALPATTMNKQITYIETAKIFSHPDNPRKDVGDVTKLAESMKANGIMQNLTVVPYFNVSTREPAENMEGNYRALIGHRRLAAAKLAGIEQVPCIIDDSLTRQEQVAIMLAENMQRSDLTAIEQADGIQMMLDLGDTKDSVSQKTGISKTTIDRRLKLLKYDRTELTEAMERGATLADFERLNEIQSPEKREMVLKTMGTPNFGYNVQRAVNEEKSDAKRQELIDKLSEFAEKVTSRDDVSGKKFVKSISTSGTDSIPDIIEGVRYYFYCDSWWAYLHRDYTSEEVQEQDKKREESEKRDKEYEKRQQTQRELSELSKVAYELRKEFMLNGNLLEGCNLQRKQLERYKMACDFCTQACMEFYIETDDFEDYCEKMGVEPVSDARGENDYIKTVESIPEIKRLVFIIWSALDSERASYYNFKNEHNENESLDFVYKMLCAFGYEMSDTEKALQNGTHELFASEEI